jgi:hypothetical protein
MQNNIKKIRDTLKVIKIIEKKYKIKPNNDVDEPLLYCGVADSDILAQLAAEVEKYFDKPYKPAGQGAFFKNFFDSFIKEVGGVRKEQTLYRLAIDEGVFMYCAFWPWGSDPVKTSVRIGLVCYGADERSGYSRLLAGDF